MEYDEDRALTCYIWEHYEQLMIEFEQRVGRAIIWRAKAAAYQSETLAAMSRRLGEAGVPAVDAALADGTEAFRRLVCERLLCERGDEIFVNRCPRCARVVRTPQARQCFWCGFDWHGASAETPDASRPEACPHRTDS